MKLTSNRVTIGSKEFRVLVKEGASRKTFFILLNSGKRVIVSRSDFNQ